MAYKFSSLILLLLASLSFSAKIENLFGDLYTKDVYGGYLKTDVEGNELYYLFFPSQSNEPLKDPVLLWLNGGPGCSSMSGMFTENGPVVTDLYSGKMHTNKHSWNNHANVLYIDSPAGVGFSKSADLKQPFNDEKTAKGLVAALKNFFAEFTDYANNEFYISGESYAGSYIPALTEEIYKEEPKAVNIKGVLIGNGVTNIETDIERSMVEFAYYHGLVSIDTFRAFERNCPHLDPESNDVEPRNVTHRCNEIRAEIQKSIEGIDVYGIYHECKKGESSSYSSREAFLTYINRKLHPHLLDPDFVFQEGELEPERGIWPSYCNADETQVVFWNDPKTQEKLGVSQKWNECSEDVGAAYTFGTHFDFYQKFINEHPELRVWKFSGDVDMCLCTLGTQRWIDRLNLKVTTEHKQWHCQGQVAGYAQKYENGFTFVTIKGAGHMVPQDKRPEAAVMVEAFLKGNLPE